MEVLNSIGFDWQVALANFINFLIIFLILRRYVFGPVKDIIEKRKHTIEDGINNAQKSETELLMSKQKAEEEIKTAKHQANQIIATAKETGDASISLAQQTAADEASSIVAKARTQIEKDKDQMEKDLLEKTAGLVALGVEKILSEDVDPQRSVSVSKRALDILKQN